MAQGSVVHGREEAASLGLSPFGQNDSAYLQDLFDSPTLQDKGMNKPKLRFLEERDQKGRSVIQKGDSGSP